MQKKKYFSSKKLYITFWTPALRQKGVLRFHHFQCVSMSVGKCVFPKRLIGLMFLKLLMKLRWFKGKKLTEQFDHTILDGHG